MLYRRTPLAVAILVLVLVLTVVGSHSETVHVEESCSTAGYTHLTDCFEDIDELNDWLWAGTSPRDPSSAAPVVVDVGQGTFSGSLLCPGYQSSPLVNDPGNPNGWVTLRGVSRKQSRIVSQEVFMATTDCDGIEMQDLSIEVSNEGGFFKGIGFYWTGVGSATVTDVDVKADYSAWYDYLCTGQTGVAGEHYFYGSKLTSGSLGYFADCGRTWLYGSEVLVKPDSESYVGTLGIAGILAQGRGDVRLFGSAVRVDLDGHPSTATTGYGLRNRNLSGASQIHTHGGIVNISSPHDHTIVGAHSEDGLVHTLETAFVLRTGSGGTATRTSGPGKVQSPLLWQASDDEPVADLKSLSGQDLFVETDCDSNGCSGSASDPRPHLMISSEECESSLEGDGTPWFDVVRGACRQ